MTAHDPEHTRLSPASESDTYERNISVRIQDRLPPA